MMSRHATTALLLMAAVLPACRGTLANINARDADCTNAFPADSWTDLLTTDPAGNAVLVELHEPSTPDKPPGGWIWKPGRLVAKAGTTFRSLITRCPVENFEIEFDWIIPPAGNSGVKYLVSTQPGPGFSKGLEYQVLDDALHPDARAGENRQSGALYDLVAPAKTKKLNPPGETNHARIVFKDGKGEHWLNGERILQFDTASQDFRARINQSKFKNIPDFAKGQRGHVLLQHHGDAVEFTLLRIRSNLVDDQTVRNPEGRPPSPAGR